MMRLKLIKGLSYTYNGVTATVEKSEVTVTSKEDAQYLLGTGRFILLSDNDDEDAIESDVFADNEFGNEENELFDDENHFIANCSGENDIKYTEESLSALTVAELNDIAKTIGVTFTLSMKKSEKVQAILNKVADE